jgi:hypothetical protein
MNKEKDIEITLEKAKFGLDMWDEDDYALMLERGNNTYFPKILKYYFNPKNVSSPPAVLNNDLETKFPIRTLIPKKRAIGMNLFGR